MNGEKSKGLKQQLLNSDKALRPSEELWSLPEQPPQTCPTIDASQGELSLKISARNEWLKTIPKVQAEKCRKCNQKNQVLLLEDTVLEWFESDNNQEIDLDEVYSWLENLREECVRIRTQGAALKLLLWEDLTKFQTERVTNLKDSFISLSQEKRNPVSLEQVLSFFPEENFPPLMDTIKCSCKNFQTSLNWNEFSDQAHAVQLTVPEDLYLAYQNYEALLLWVDAIKTLGMDFFDKEELSLLWQRMVSLNQAA